MVFLVPLPAEARLKDNRLYDHYIEEAVNRYWPDVPIPELLKAQLYQESRLDPKAVSPVGARGISQFMPKTWTEVAKTLGFSDADILEPRRAIPASSYYMGTLRRSGILRSLQDPDKHTLAQAAYNAGIGNIQKAKRLALRPDNADSVIDALPRVTGRHAKETKTYIERINRWFLILMEDAPPRRKLLAHALGFIT